MRILVTGGAGFIGSNFVRHALAAGHEVRIIDDFSTGYQQNISGLEIEVIEASILDTDRLNSAMNGVEAVIHLAALGSVPRSIREPINTHAVNASGTLNVLCAARDAEVSHVSVASSSSVYGMNPSMPKTERDWVRPMSPYAVTKLATEQYALAAQDSYGLATAAFRFFNVYGPRQRPGHAYAAVVPIFLDAIMRSQPLPINGDGTNSRDFTFVDTVCAILLETAENRVVNPEPINLAFGSRTNLLELVDAIGEATGMLPRVDHRPPRLGDVKHSQASNETLRRLFPGVSPVSLSVGLNETFKWFREEIL